MNWNVLGLVGTMALTGTTFGDLIVMHHNSVARHDERTGAVLSHEKPAPRTLVESTESGIIGPDGSIYVVGNSLGAGSIERFNGQTGAFSDTFVDEDDTALARPMGMAFGPDGDLYICSENGGVFRFDAKTGAEKPMFIPVGTESTFIIRFGSDGDAYVLESTGIVRFRGTSGERVGMVVPGQASDFAFGADGRLYVLDRDIRRYDADTGADLGVFATAASGELDVPVRIAFGPNGDLYVGEHRTLKVKRFDRVTGAYRGVFAESPQMPYFDHLNGLAFTPQRLTISATAGGPQIMWPNTFGHFKLEKRNSLDASSSWSAVEENPTPVGGDLTLKIPSGPVETYFRLVKED